MRSIKLKITLWYTIIILILSALFMGVVLYISKESIETSTEQALTEAVISAGNMVEFEHGMVEINGNLDFFDDGVYISVYDADGEMIFGRLPKEFDKNIDFTTNAVHQHDIEGIKWYVFDTAIESKIVDDDDDDDDDDKYNDGKGNEKGGRKAGWVSEHEGYEDSRISESESVSKTEPVPNAGNGLAYIRGVSYSSESANAIKSILKVSLIVLPLLLAFAAVGGYLTTKRAFAPINKIRRSAEEISGGKDLSKRIGLDDTKDEISKLAMTFDGMLERLETSFENEKQFTSDASHELRTPTAVIISQCEYALEDAQTVEEYRAALNVTLDQAQKISLLISRLLEFARTDKGSTKLHIEPINISELCEIVSEQQRDAASEKNIDIITDIEGDVVINADETLIFRMLINLITNAVKYGRENGHIWVSLNKTSDKIVGSIKDDGIGIAPDAINRIWERFYQADQVRGMRSENGMGLGLSMVKWIAEAHGGSVSVKSTLGKGSEFTFVLPVNQALNK